MSARQEGIRSLWRTRPKSRFARLSGVALAALAIYSWASGTFSLKSFFTERAGRNLDRFLGELRPHPLAGREWNLGVFREWLQDSLAGKGTEAVLSTVAMSVAAIVLAGIGAALLSLTAARNVATPEPFVALPRAPGAAARWLWRGVVGITRLILIFFRAIPEYVWGFLFLALLGPGAWPAVLALALHNTGILGKLFAEVVENVEPGTPRAMRALGATRLQIAAVSIFPATLGRFLLYFFYRWETCVREATVLGLLGFMSLGWYIQDSRARMHYDEMFLFILLGSAITLVGDLLSTLARRRIRTA